MAEEARITVTIDGRPVEVELTLSIIEAAARSDALTANVGSIGTELNNPNLAAMAEAVGIGGIRLEKPGPVLIDAVVNRMELAMPPAVNLEMAKGFSLYMVKAILNGQADQVIDLAQTNLWR